jgi:hypothetical protein
MRTHVGGMVSAGILCAIAATVALWSGPLTAASSALHTSAQQPVHVVVARSTSSRSSRSMDSASSLRR